MKVAKEGLLFILPSVLLAAGMLVLGWWPASLPFFLVAAAFLFFFRDPRREIPKDGRLLLAPADGKVVKIETSVSHPWLTEPVSRVSIFLSLYDVHITRAPLSGRVQKIEYTPGRFFPAYKNEASLANEHNTVLIKGESGEVLIRQMVGVAARRIKCFVREAEEIRRGQKIGLMYFGSRVEIYLPPSVALKVRLDQRTKAGETIIGEVQP